MSGNRRSPTPPAIDTTDLTARTGSGYPAPHHEPMQGRVKRVIGNALGLTNFGVNLVHLAPGAWSSQRHWHTREDEMIYVLEGEVTLITDAGEQVLEPGMAAGFPAGKPDGHHLVNRSDKVAVFLEIGDRKEDEHVYYSDIDLEVRVVDGRAVYTRKNGEPVER
ncbi:cupin domain-containing protein [Polyangium aurulentum]|uniref:cupin domain-containing protein n=1 Tax=Polyangium aurulentum TaxID=2567896 RepID=UPI0010ADD9CB|nr:cupin domain-containing protein [Polyangium aurulentum]UQA58410.1 cupin domain-containing protein [Polyangium aurulentum]